MTGFTALLVFCVVFFAFGVFLKVPLVFVMALSAITLMLFGGLSYVPMTAASFGALDSFPLMAIPFYIMAGALMEYSGISEGLVNLVKSLMGRIKGSIGHVCVLASMAFGAISGSCTATLVSIGKMMVPQMEKHGYKRSYACALAAASSFLGIMIPPSVPGIIYATQSGANIQDVWLSTLIAGILFGIGFIIINYIIMGKKEAPYTEPFKVKKYARTAFSSTFHAMPALVMPIIIFGGIYGGIFTPTEAGAVCCLYGFLYYFIQKIRQKIGKQVKLFRVIGEAAALTAIISISISFGAGVGKYFALTNISSALAEWLLSNVHSKVGFLLLLNVLFLFLGMLIDINVTTLLMTNLLLPAANAYGIDTIHFGAIMLVNMSVGYLTPPMAASTFLIAKLADCSFVEIVKDTIPFVLWGLVVIALVTFIPWFSLAFM